MSEKDSEPQVRMTDDDAKTQPLTIYLARSGLSDVVDASAKARLYDIKINGDVSARLWIEPPHASVPKWIDLFDGYLEREEIGTNSSISAALTVQVGGRLYVLTFGNGRFLIKPDSYEERFGLRVTLNCIGEGTVRSIDKQSLDQLLRHSREQTSRDASAGEFGFDVEQDLLKAVTGKPDPVYRGRFGTRISGFDSLHLSVPIRLSGLPSLLEDIGERFRDLSYKKKFPWVDQISEVTDAKLRSQLDELVVNKIAAGNTDNIWMAVPDLISWEKIHGFKFITRHKTPVFPDIHLDNFLACFRGEQLNVDLFMNREVRAVDRDGQKCNKWAAYRCLCAELEYRGESFLLSGGSWHKVKAGFVNEVNKAYDAIPDYERTLPKFHHKSEGEYLKDVSGQNPQRFALMDQKNISYGGGYSRIEFCDLFTSDNDLIHVKRYGQASSLSHLFAQGLISGELFRMEARFRELVNAKLPDSHRLEDTKPMPRPNRFRVVYAVISDRPGALRLPFFSRLNLKHACRRLEAYGFKVAKAKIEVAEEFSKLSRYE